MLDWNSYRQELSSTVGELAKLTPATVRGYVTMSSPPQGAAIFDEKTRELISIAVAITLRCDGCIAVHTESARKHGATKAEIAEAMGIAVNVNAGAAIVYATRALDAFDAAVEAL